MPRFDSLLAVSGLHSYPLWNAVSFSWASKVFRRINPLVIDQPELEYEEISQGNPYSIPEAVFHTQPVEQTRSWLWEVFGQTDW